MQKNSSFSCAICPINKANSIVTDITIGNGASPKQWGLAANSNMDTSGIPFSQAVQNISNRSVAAVTPAAAFAYGIAEKYIKPA